MSFLCPLAGAQELLSFGNFSGGSASVLSTDFGNGSTWEAGPNAPTGIWITRAINAGTAPSNQSTWYTDSGQLGDAYIGAAGGSGPGTFQAIQGPATGEALVLNFDYLLLANGSAPQVRLLGANAGAYLSKFSSSNAGFTVLYEYDTQPDASPNWATHSTEITLTQQFDFLVLQFTSAGGGVDNVSLIAAIPPPVNLQELLSHGNFEGGSSSVLSNDFGNSGSWEAGLGAPTAIWLTRAINTGATPSGQSTWYTDDGQSGDFYINAASGSGPGTFQPVLAPSPGADLIITFDFKLYGSSAPAVRILGANAGSYLNKFNSGEGALTELYSYSTKELATTDWMTFTHSFQLTQAFDFLIFQFTNASGLVDNVSLAYGVAGEEEPPPPPPPTNNSLITVNVIANRTSGVAPLAVHLNASGTSTTSGADSFHDLNYSWNFGNPGAGNFATTGLPRNEAKGPIAAHVFDQPGTYHISLTVEDDLGTTATQSVEITVEDPDVVFSGTNTVCISNTGDFSGAPSGALQVTATDLNAAISTHLNAGMRVLLNRGETWTISTPLKRIGFPGPGILGAYGEGHLPKITMTTQTSILQTWWYSGATGANDWRIMDLHLVNTAATPSTGIGLAGNPVDVLLYRIKTEYMGLSAYFGGGGVRDGHESLARNCFIIDCDFSKTRNTNATGDRGGYGVFGAIENGTIQGNRVTEHTNGEHCLRFSYAKNTVIANNHLADPWSIKHVITLRAPDWTNSSPPLTNAYTENVLISDNNIFGGDSTWTVTIHPSNSNTDGRIRDVIFERNFISADNGGSRVITVSGSDVTVRNNIITNWSRNHGDAFMVEQRGIEPAPQNVRIYNNTIYTTAASSDILVTDEAPQDIFLANNLIVSDGIVQLMVLSVDPSVVTATNNLTMATSELQQSPPVQVSDFTPKPTSSAIDAGLNIVLYQDFEGAIRPQGNGIDIGAIEAQ